MNKIISALLFLVLGMVIVFLTIDYNRKTISIRFKQFLSDDTPYIMEANEDVDKRIVDKQCTPTKIWMLNRGGVRFPSHHPKLTELHEAILNSKDILLRSDERLYERFIRWVDYGYGLQTLTETGRVEMGDLAKRMKKRFPELLKAFCTVFESSYGPIVKNSKKAFMREILHAEMDLESYPPAPRSLVLTLPHACDNMRKSYKQNMIDLHQSFSHQKLRAELEHEIEKISNVLNTTITMIDADVLYQAFASETAWKPNQRSVWELVLTVPFARIQDNIRDLTFYYQDGYHNEQNYKAACLVFKQIIDFFEDTHSRHKARVYFTDNRMHLKLLTLLGLYNDGTDPLGDGRKWKLSKIGGFATNLVFVQLSCNNDTYVQFLHQEKTVPIPECNEKSLPQPKCSFAKFKEIIEKKVETCTFREMCETPAK